MEYIVYRNFSGEAICGKVDLPIMALCECTRGFIHDDKNVYCFDHSQNAYEYFARNDDGKGLERGNLIQRIKNKLSTDKDRQSLWDKIWEDDICANYKRKEHADFWVWNHEFYNASIEDLRYIAGLINA